MPRSIVTVRSRVKEGNHVYLTNRIIMADGTQLVQSDVGSGSSIEVRVYDISGGGEGRRPDASIFTKTDIGVTTGGPGGGAAILDTYATTYWDGKDSTGYNFIYKLEWDSAGATGPYLRGGHTYLVEFRVDCDEGDTFGIVRWTHILDVEPSDAS